MLGGQGFVWSARILLVGERSSGKSCLLRRYLDGTFTDAYVGNQLGVDFRIHLDDGEKVRLVIVDPDDTYKMYVDGCRRGITSASFRNTQGIMVVFDVGDEASFQRVGHWLKESEKHAPRGVRCVLVGTKADRDKRVVTLEDIRAFAEKSHVSYWETSAKDGSGVNQAFEALIEEMALENQQRIIENKQSSTEKKVDHSCTFPWETCLLI